MNPFNEDNRPEFEENVQIVKIKSFYTEQEARLYEAHLKAAGIASFVTDANTITAIPLGVGGIGLHVKMQDVEAARRLFEDLESSARRSDVEVSFHDADQAEIEYQRALHQPIGSNWLILWLILLLIGLFIYQALRS